MSSRSAGRVIVVLGYSNGGTGIHSICAARVARAAEIATPDDVVVLSGWARVPHMPSEAHLMEAAWDGAAREVVLDPDAQTTVGNAANALNDIRRVRAREVVVVTSRWHAARAKAAFRLLLHGSDVRVRAAYPVEAFALRPALSELPLWLLLPVQVWGVRRETRAPA